MLPSKWKKILEHIDFAFQPIVHATTGKVYAVEALLRNINEINHYSSIFSFFDDAYHDGVLYTLDIHLRKKAFKKFGKIPIENIKLFYNLDNRIMIMPDFKPGNTIALLEKLNIPREILCFEISERGTLDNPSNITNIVNQYKMEGFSMAIDDFGTGISGLQLLYYSEPDFLKLDRFFIQSIEKDSRKRHFCASIIQMAHTMGIEVIAEGIETKQEYYTCIELGADFVQGYLIAHPATDIRQLEPIYKTVKKMYSKEHRKESKNIIDEAHIDYIDPILDSTDLHGLFTYFKEHSNNSFAPVTDQYGQVLGVVYEEDFKKISYSVYGMSLAKNRSINTDISTYIKPATTVELSHGIDNTLAIYNDNPEEKRGIFITLDNAYHGFIDLNSLLSLSYKRTLEIAENKNPLTKLPGNDQVHKFIKTAFDEDKSTLHHMIYLDFNDFKPFNDHYGFRQGDRAILLFSDILKKELPSTAFIAHIGGDDFFVGLSNERYEQVFSWIQTILYKFKESAINLYDKNDQERGCVKMKDRYGISRTFPLLSVAGAIVEVCHQSIDLDLDTLLVIVKKSSKIYSDGVPVGSSILQHK
ncbi:MAG: GGDEF domain-containing protein [Campylobacterota bacterium]|nr:GGDEF domain-containing protein [Campylobacterota bacterium]